MGKAERKVKDKWNPTASLVARLSLGVSSDWEPPAQAAGPRDEAWSLAVLFSVRCLVTMSWRTGHTGTGG